MEPLDGEKLVIFGFTLKVCGLVSVVEPVVAVTAPVMAPTGTFAVRYVVAESVTEMEATPPNFTTVALLKPCPNMPTFVPTMAVFWVGSRFTNAASPVATLKKTPWQGLQEVGPPEAVVPYTSPFVFFNSVESGRSPSIVGLRNRKAVHTFSELSL